MYIYFLIILISSLCIALSEKKEKEGSKKSSCFFCIIGCLLLILLASLRKIGVGTDTKAYISLDFFNALRFDDFFTYYKYSENEFIHLLINFIVSRFTSNVQIIFGVMHALVIFLMYWIAKRNKNNAPIWLTYSILLLLYYNKSLNMLRQMISILIIVFAIPFLKEKKYFKYFFSIIIALGFHVTAIIGVIIAIVYTITKNKINNFFVIIFFIILVLLNYSSIITVLVDIGFLEVKYLEYINTDKINVSTTEIIIKTIILSIVLLYCKGLNKINKENKFYLYMMIIDWILYLFGFFCNYAERFSYYFGIFQIFVLTQIPKLGVNKKNENIILFFVVFYAILYCWIMYGCLKIDETVPYLIYFK